MLACGYCGCRDRVVNQIVDADEGGGTFRCVRCGCPFAMGPALPPGPTLVRERALFPPAGAPSDAPGFSAWASNNRLELERARCAHCIFCCKTYDAAAINVWIDGSTTALCPECGFDVVVPATAGDRDRPEWWVGCAQWRRDAFGSLGGGLGGGLGGSPGGYGGRRSGAR